MADGEPSGIAAPFATVGEIIRSLAIRLRRSGFDTADVDARRLVSAVVDFSPERLIVDADVPMTAAAATRLETFAERRLTGEPVSRIVGRRGFYGRDFMIGPAVLDPRPDTETLIDVALAAIDSWLAGASPVRPFRLLDIGVGSGAILLTLLAERAAIHGVGIDVSADALAIAHVNADAIGVSARVELRQLSIADALRTPFDLVVSNPPYIPTGDIAVLDPDVRNFDPMVALDGGRDGLAVYREIFVALAETATTAPVVLEFGAGQASSVCNLAYRLWLPSAACRATVVDDLGGRPRCVILEPHI